jgi:hypothetical protein
MAAAAATEASPGAEEIESMPKVALTSELGLSQARGGVRKTVQGHVQY